MAEANTSVAAQSSFSHRFEPEAQGLKGQVHMSCELESQTWKNRYRNLLCFTVVERPRNKCLTSSNKKLVETSATLVVTGALLVVTRS